jgi:hypothetical protein
MKIDNIRIMNNKKVKLINTKLTGVDVKESRLTEQGTRVAIIPTPPKSNPS